MLAEVRTGEVPERERLREVDGEGFASPAAVRVSRDFALTSLSSWICRCCRNKRTAAIASATAVSVCLVFIATAF
jgi:hypothetical protein